MQHKSFLSTDTLPVRIILEPGYRWLRHLLFCMLLLIVSYQNVIYTFGKDADVLGSAIPVLIIIEFALYLSFYLNIYLFVPRFFLKGRYMTYSLSLLALLTVNFAASYFMEIIVTSIYNIEPSSDSYASPSRWVWVDYLSLVTVSGMCCLGTTITILLRNWLTDGKRKQDMESRQQRNRIMEFKDMVNPDFLSNVLYAASTHTDSDAILSGEILTRLSRYLRYRLYDSNREVVFLSSESAFLDNYLSLVANIRDRFTYSISSPVPTGRAVLHPSVLTGVTDAVLNNIPAEFSLDMIMEFQMVDRRGIKLNISVQSPGAPPTQEMEGIFGKILDMSYPSSYDLTVRGGGGHLYICIGLYNINTI